MVEKAEKPVRPAKQGGTPEKIGIFSEKSRRKSTDFGAVFSILHRNTKKTVDKRVNSRYTIAELKRCGDSMPFSPLVWLWGDGMNTDRKPEGALPIAEAAAGDEKAFVAVLCRMTPMIQSLIRQCVTPGTVEQEDLLQESLEGLLAAVRTFRADDSARFTTYAYACIRNRLVSLTRRSGARLRREQALEDEELTDSASADPALLVQERESAERLRRVLAERLTPLEREVLSHRMVGHTYEQTARALGVDKKAVDNAIQRLRRKLSPGT